MNDVLLSICIPTYNREQYLSSTLDSIVSQLDDCTRNRVEICISDNASLDGTESLVAEYKIKHPHIVYHRWQENMGADRNYLKVAEIASGEYCWLFGSDDVMVDGAIRLVISELETKPDIVVYERAESDHLLSGEPVSSSWTALPGNYDFDSLRERSHFLNYISSCRSFGGLFSYLSVIVFSNKRWRSIAHKDRFVGSAYVHVHILLEMLRQGAVFHYRHTVVVLCRMGNDSFLSDDSLAGHYRRIQLDVDGYREIPMHVFGSDSEEYQLIHSLVGRNLPILGLMKYKLAFIRLGDFAASKKMDRMLLANKFPVKYFCIALMGNHVISKILNLLLRSGAHGNDGRQQ